MLPRAVVVWFAILAIAFMNGGVREVWLVPRLGDAIGHVLSTLTLCGAILVVSWFSMQWVGVTTRRDAIRIGLLWVASTLTFEFLAGHYLFGTPWRQLLADYDILAGRIWILVLLATVCAPVLALHARRVLLNN